MASSWRPNWVGVVVGLVIAGAALSASVGSYEGASRGGGGYVVLWGAVLAGGALAFRSLTRTRASIEADAQRRVGQAKAELLKRTMSPREWEDFKAHQSARAGKMLSDGEVATRVIAENRVREDDGAARWRANAAKAYAPIVKELKASMTAAEWDAKRADAKDRMRSERENAKRYWLEHSAPFLPPELRTLPDHLDPGKVHVTKDWQVAMYLRPMKLDNEGNPVATAA